MREAEDSCLVQYGAEFQVSSRRRYLVSCLWLMTCFLNSAESLLTQYLLYFPAFLGPGGYSPISSIMYVG